MSLAGDLAIKQWRQLHACGKGYAGLGVFKHWRRLAALAREHECVTALEFGCGKGQQYRRQIYDHAGAPRRLAELLVCDITAYDPAVPEFSSEPAGKFDLVYCVDVLAHVPESDLPALAGRLAGLARKVLFVAIATWEANKRFPDGRSIDLTVKPAAWWHELFAGLAEPAIIALDIG